MCGQAPGKTKGTAARGNSWGKPQGVRIEYVGVPRKDRGHAFQDVIIIIIVRIVDQGFPIISRLPSFLSGVAIIG